LTDRGLECEDCAQTFEKTDFSSGRIPMGAPVFPAINQLSTAEVFVHASGVLGRVLTADDSSDPLC
jgi:hypothetical protein